MTSKEDATSMSTEVRVQTHPVTPADKAAMAGLRAMVEPNKGKMRGPSARGAFDAIVMRVAVPEGVSFEAGIVGGIAGSWCRPAGASVGQVLLHLHGGWYNWGTAQAFQHLVGHIARRAGTDAFIPDYRLAPEHAFPAAMLDVQTCYRGLIDAGYDHIAVVGDSAGGGLALSLLTVVAEQTAVFSVRPKGAVVLSPVTDLKLEGGSWQSRAKADPYFTKPQAAELISYYLAGHNPADPIASPLYADLVGLPPIRVHVGDDEVLLDDSRRYVARAVAAGVDATLDVWEGMPHGFASGAGRISAADDVLAAVGTFLAERLRENDETDDRNETGPSTSPATPSSSPAENGSARDL